MKIILCDDILELVGKEVNKIRNIQWWIDNYGYHLPNYKFILNHNQLKRKDTNSTHAVKIALQFNHYINTNLEDKLLVSSFLLYMHRTKPLVITVKLILNSDYGISDNLSLNKIIYFSY